MGLRGLERGEHQGLLLSGTESDYFAPAVRRDRAGGEVGRPAAPGSGGLRSRRAEPRINLLAHCNTTATSRSTSCRPTRTVRRRSTCARSPSGSAAATSRCGGPSGASARPTAPSETRQRARRRSWPADVIRHGRPPRIAFAYWVASDLASRRAWREPERLFHGGFRPRWTIGNLRKPRFWGGDPRDARLRSWRRLSGDGGGGLVEAWPSR